MYGSSGCQKQMWNWNPYGNGLMFENFPFPVVTMVNNASATEFLINQVLLPYHCCSFQFLCHGIALC